MCGICGIVTPAGFADAAAAESRVLAMLRSLSHRGPDDVGKIVAPSGMLGATRLAIRGLEEEASQPMVDPETGVIAVCNGEIDNHRELRKWLADRGRVVRQQTDVAVIPGLFLEMGENFSNALVGAFAVAVWDPRQGQLWLARDRAGERPLFFATLEKEILFATEIAALVSGARLPVELSSSGLRKYLQFGIFPAPETPFLEIQKVAPGERIRFESGNISRQRYWRWQNTESPKTEPSLDAFDKTFRAAVARQSDVDVDFGIFLSGGIDSSLVAAVARSLHSKRPLKAYTLRFEEESYDEGDYAGMVARQFELEPVTVWVRPEDLRTELKVLLHLVGEPLADPAWLPSALLARRAAQDVKLALVGEGADELFGGYPTYIGAQVGKHFAALPPWMKTLVRRAIETLPPTEKKVTISFLLKRFVQGADLDSLARHQLWVSNISPVLLRRLGVEPMPLENRDESDGLVLDRVQRWDLETSLAEGLLTKADRASMSSALELRAPFLDESVMEYAKSFRVEDRVRGFNTKVFLKEYALRYLPRDIVHRRKRGLSVPIGRWLRGPLREWAEGTLGSGRLDQVGIAKAAALELFSEHCEHRADHARALWTLIVLSEWLEWVANQKDGSKLEAKSAC